MCPYPKVWIILQEESPIQSEHDCDAQNITNLSEYKKAGIFYIAGCCKNDPEAAGMHALLQSTCLLKLYRILMFLSN